MVFAPRRQASVLTGHRAGSRPRCEAPVWRSVGKAAAVVACLRPPPTATDEAGGSICDTVAAGLAWWGSDSTRVSLYFYWSACFFPAWSNGESLRASATHRLWRSRSGHTGGPQWHRVCCKPPSPSVQRCPQAAQPLADWCRAGQRRAAVVSRCAATTQADSTVPHRACASKEAQAAQRRKTRVRSLSFIQCAAVSARAPSSAQFGYVSAGSVAAVGIHLTWR